MRYAGRKVGVPAVGEDGAKLVGDVVGADSGEDAAYGAVEVEEEGFGVGEDSADDFGVVYRNVGHRAYSVATVVHMLSNQERDCSTYWLPVLVSSSLMEWWKRIASLPIRS